MQGSTGTTVQSAVWSQLPGNAGNHRGEGQSWLAKTHRGAPFVGGMDNISDQFTSKELCDIGGFPGNGCPLLLQCVQLSTSESALNRPALLGCPPPAFFRSVFCYRVYCQIVLCRSVFCQSVFFRSVFCHIVFCRSAPQPTNLSLIVYNGSLPLSSWTRLLSG